MLTLQNLTIWFGDPPDRTTAVQDAAFTVAPGESFGLVGESGSGKSTILRAVAGLIPSWSGLIEVDGRAVTGARRDRAFHKIVQMVFQDPYASLHPRHSVDRVLSETLYLHGLNRDPRRIDRLLDGTAVIYDYKSGSPPSRKQMLAFDKQLPLEAAMVERGAFGAPMAVADLRYIRLGGTGATEPRGWDDDMRATWDQFTRLIEGYLSGAHGFTARRAMERTTDNSAYDQLSRHGEWSEADTPHRIEVGRG